MIYKFIKSSISFFVVAITAYSILVISWGLIAPDSLRQNLRNPDGGSFLNRRLAEVKEVEDVDILFIGPSTTYLGFDSRIFREAGYKNFNLGSGAQTPKQTNVLLKRYLDQLNPKLVVYELFPVMLEHGGVGSTHDLLYHDDIDPPLLQTILNTRPNIKIFNALLFHGFTQLFSIENPNLYESKSGSKYVSGGYVEIPLRYNQRLRLQEFSGEGRSLELSKGSLGYLDENLQMLRDREIPYLLVRAPITSYEYQFYQNNKEIDSLYNTKGEFYNFQEIMSLSDTLDFKDHAHLNLNGVRNFNEAVLKIIRERE